MKLPNPLIKFLLRQERNSQPRSLDHLEFDLERLERRDLLAGTVNVVVKGDSLVITGDARDNEFAVDESGGTIVVSSLFGNGTTIIGGDTGLSNDDLQNVTIKTKGGDDYFEIGRGITIRGNLSIKAGGGDDLVDFIAADGGVTIDGKTQIKLGGGGDCLYFDGTTFGGDVVVAGGGGNDDIYVSEYVPTVEFQGAVTMKLGGGDDELYVDATTVIDYSLTSLNGGGGFDGVFPSRATLEASDAKVSKFESDLSEFTP